MDSAVIFCLPAHLQMMTKWLTAKLCALEIIKLLAVLMAAFNTFMIVYDKNETVQQKIFNEMCIYMSNPKQHSLNSTHICHSMCDWHDPWCIDPHIWPKKKRRKDTPHTSRPALFVAHFNHNSRWTHNKNSYTFAA